MLDNYITKETILRNWIDESIPTTQLPLSLVYSFGALHVVTLFNPIQQPTDSCVGEGTSDTETFGIYGSVQALRKKKNNPSTTMVFTVLQGQHPDPGREGRKATFSLLTMLMYQNLFSEVKLKKNYKITTYLYQINLIDHQNHPGTLKKPILSRLYPGATETKSFGVG